MGEELSEKALSVAKELLKSPATDGIWRGGFAACWEDAEEETEGDRTTIEVYEIVGVDSCPGADQKSVHGHRLATMPVRELTEHHEAGESVPQSADAA